MSGELSSHVWFAIGPGPFSQTSLVSVYVSKRARQDVERHKNKHRHQCWCWHEPRALKMTRINVRNVKGSWVGH
jgi:hypothetical protein